MADETAKNPSCDRYEFLSQANHGRTIATYRAKQAIFSQGDVADSVFYIQKGKVKVTVTSEHGKEAVIAILDRHEFFGEGCVAGQKRRMATATAMTACEVMKLGKGVVERALHDQPAFADIFVKHLLSRAIRAEEDLTDQLFNSSEKRLARALLLLANYGKDGEPGPITARVSQETLAEMIGTTRSRVSHFMNKFRKLGLIDYDGQIEVHKSLLKLVLHEQPEIRM
jgi:CRP/FNR family transcriptional regulator, cyclic AMP receptor protein